MWKFTLSSTTKFSYCSLSHFTPCTDIGEAASDLVLVCLRNRNVDLAIKVYTLVKENSFQSHIHDDASRSLLNALCSVKRFMYARDVFQQLTDSVLVPVQSYDAPRCIYLHRSNTVSEIAMIVKDYLQCLYNKYVDLARNTEGLTTEHLQLKIAFHPQTRFTADQQEVSEWGKRERNCKVCDQSFTNLEKIGGMSGC